jgi:NADPH2:quinone reductase
MPGAITFRRTGPPTVLQWSTVEPLKPGAEEIVICVEAAGVNNADLLQRRGTYPVASDAPNVLGLECAGRVSSVGSAVTEWSPGDRVCALLDGGGYADEVAVPAVQVMPIPESVGTVEAAALPEAACTVYSNLALIARLRAGQSVLIHGATGGIGTFAIQWARAIGASVITTASSDSKAAIGRRLGAQVAINYHTEDFVAATLDATNGAGVDAILDVVGIDYLDRNLQCLAQDGHLVIIGGSLAPGTIDLKRLMARRASMSASALRPRPRQQKAEIVAGVRADVLPLVESGAIRPVIATVVPMRDAAKAHALLESGSTVGKIVLDNRDTTIPA